MNQKLSIVIGSNNALNSISDCLSVLEKQREGRKVEIIVVDNSIDGTDKIVKERFPSVKLIRSPESKFIPELWEIGVKQSNGDIISITTAHCIPSNNWVDEIFHAHQRQYAGIGGAIEKHTLGTIVDWAIYFCRYSHYMLPFSESLVNDFAGDNASYKREALELCKTVRSNGFWEPSIHSELINKNLQLLITPKIIVYYKKSYSFFGFLKQRFWHGRNSGNERAKELSHTKRIIIVLLSFLIPFILLFRISRRVIINKRYLKEFLISTPPLIIFLISWSIGEFSGYLISTGTKDKAQ